MAEDKQPQRLQSISSRGGRGGRGIGRGGRFLPKAVDRRSKEERESSAPAMKTPEPEPTTEAKPQRGKYERKKPKQLGIRAEAAGPLAAPSIAGPSRSAKGPSGSSSSGGRSVGGGGPRVKTEADPSIHMMANDERIDMGTPRGGFFPVRLPVSAVETKAEDGEAPQKKDESASRIEGLGDGDMIIVQLPDLGLKPARNSQFASSQTENVREDQQASEGQENGVKIKSEEGAEEQDQSMVDALDTENNTEIQTEPTKEETDDSDYGYMGKIVCYKSGRVVQIIGDSVFELQSAPVSTVDNVVMLNEGSNSASLLGPTVSRVLVTPDLENLQIH